MQVRLAEPADVDHLARLWNDVWHETHAALHPPELAAVRTFESFRARLQATLPDVCVAGPSCAPLGFCIIKGAELYQLFVSPEGRGLGLAAALLADAEKRLAARGVGTSWLLCVIGNDRAARFYEKFGWRLAGTIMKQPDGLSRKSPVEMWRYEKSLAAGVA